MQVRIDQSVDVGGTKVPRKATALLTLPAFDNRTPRNWSPWLGSIFELQANDITVSTQDVALPKNPSRLQVYDFRRSFHASEARLDRIAYRLEGGPSINSKRDKALNDLLT